MNQVYLINKDTFADFEDISLNVPDKRIAVFVKKAQDLDLKLFFGHAFYYDFIKWFNDDGSFKNNTPDSYKNLFNGVEYQDRFGNDIIFEGVIPALIYWTFARFIEADGVHYTATGPVYKSGDNSQALTVSEKTKLVQQQRSVANAHANEVQKFLMDNRKDYPLWNYNSKNKSGRQSGPRLRGVDRTDFNMPYNNGLNNNLTDYLY